MNRIFQSNNDNESSLKIFPLNNRGITVIVLIWLIWCHTIFFPITNFDTSKFNTVVYFLIGIFYLWFVGIAVSIIVWNQFYTVEIKYNGEAIKITRSLLGQTFKVAVLEKNTRLFLDLPPFQKKFNLDFDTFGIGEWTLYAIHDGKKIKIVNRLKKNEVPQVIDWIKLNKLEIK